VRIFRSSKEETMTDEKKKGITALLVGAGVLTLAGIGVIASLFRSQPSSHASADTEDENAGKRLRTPPKATSKAVNHTPAVGTNLLDGQARTDAGRQSVKKADEIRWQERDYDYRQRQDDRNRR
jgi:flagellar basal body-associated protein FliL